MTEGEQECCTNSSKIKNFFYNSYTYEALSDEMPFPGESSVPIGIT